VHSRQATHRAASKEGPPTLTTAYESTDASLAVHTLDEAAAILRVRKSWLERQAAARAIPFTMLGGAYRFTSGHLAAIVRIHEKIPAAAELDETPEPVAPRHAPRARKHASDLPTVTPLRPRPRPIGPRRVA
jgi:excisionase family DNA binding protein